MVLFIAGIVAINVIALTQMDSKDFFDDVVVEVNDKKTRGIDVTLTDFLPGESRTYEILLKNEGDKEYELAMRFKKSGQDTLAPFIDVTVKIGEEQLLAKKLSEAFTSEEISLPVNLEVGSETKIEITYSMDLEVGDEAQKTEADFEIQIYAK